MEKDIDADFKDINEESKYKNYIIVSILYVLVVILVILLIIGLKNQKDVVQNNFDSNINYNNNIEK